MLDHAYMLENWLVNYAFSTLFPLGPQTCPNPKSVYMIPRGVFAAYMLLVIHYTFVKNLLIGLAGYHGQDFCEAHVVELMQAFSKDVGHDAPYLEHVLKFFEEHGMMNVAYAAMIIRN
jgi:lysine-N-methylase